MKPHSMKHRLMNGLTRTPWGFASSSGQALVETALIVPFLLMLALNTINFGYFFLVAVNLAAAPRSGALYSIVGSATPTSLSLPAPGSPSSTTSVSYLTYRDMTGALYSPTTQATLQVCSVTASPSSPFINPGTSQTVKCVTCSGSSCGSAGAGSPTPHSDLESPSFVLNRVDVSYQFTPLIPGTPFNIVLLASPVCTTAGGVTCTFHRFAEMREMN